MSKLKGAKASLVIIDEVIRSRLEPGGLVPISTPSPSGRASYMGEEFAVRNIKWGEHFVTEKDAEQAQRDEELSFALAFQEEMAGEDLREVPEELHEPMRKSLGLVIKRCKSEVPCYVRSKGGAVACPCKRRAGKWVSFWKLVRFDLEGRLPTALRESVDFNGPVLHRPIFTHICPGCGKRCDSYQHSYLWREPALTSARHDPWRVITVFVRPIDRIIGLHKGDTHLRAVCSQSCGEKMLNKEWSFYEPENMDYAWRQRRSLPLEKLQLLAGAWGVHPIGDDHYKLCTRLEQHVRKLAPHLVPPLPMLLPETSPAPPSDLVDALSYAQQGMKRARREKAQRANKKIKAEKYGGKLAARSKRTHRRGNR